MHSFHGRVLWIVVCLFIVLYNITLPNLEANQLFRWYLFTLVSLVFLVTLIYNHFNWKHDILVNELLEMIEIKLKEKK